MTDAPRRDRDRHVASCRGCGFVLGRMAPGSQKPDYTPGVRVMIDLRNGWMEVFCPRCGARRRFTDVVVHAMTIPELPA